MTIYAEEKAPFHPKQSGRLFTFLREDGIAFNPIYMIYPEKALVAAQKYFKSDMVKIVSKNDMGYLKAKQQYELKYFCEFEGTCDFT